MPAPYLSWQEAVLTPVDLAMAATQSHLKVGVPLFTPRAAQGQFRSAALDQNESFSFKFDQPGSFQYGCSLHATMAGIVIVRPQ